MLKFLFILLFTFQFLIAQGNPYLIILGNIQDGGSPHIGCKKKCCEGLFQKPDRKRKVTSLGLLVPETKKKFLFEATPDISFQLNLLNNQINSNTQVPDGIFITHAHIGHYTGLMHFGREAMGADKVKVFAMPKLKYYFENNGPWNQLVDLQNIQINEIKVNDSIYITPEIIVIPLIVPHRDEYSETVGFKINGPNKKALFIPDIDKWSKWSLDIIEEVKDVDFAFLDGTFFDSNELNNRDMSEIPHPFIIETIELFKNQDKITKSKIHFIHFNHTNPILNKESKEFKLIKENGFNIANYLDKFEL